MSVVLLGSTSGSITLQEPAVAGSTVIDLPATSGTMAVTSGSPSFTNITATGTLTVNGNTTLGDASTDTILMTGAPSIGGAGLGMGMGFRNRIINGAMVIDQRNAGASVTAVNGAYTVDRWLCTVSQSSKFTAQQNAPSLGSVTPPVGYTNYLGCTSSSAYSVISTDYLGINQRIEGFNIADFGWGAAGAATVTLSFWVRSSLTGTFGGSIMNSGFNRSYPFSYTISAANTWEQKSITIAGDTSGTWLTTNGVGARVFFSLGCGSTRLGTAGSWTGSSDIFSAIGETSVVGTSGATFYITGVQLEKGSTATSFDYRPYGTELALCQRYYIKINNPTANAGYGAIVGGYTTVRSLGSPHCLPVSMRVTGGNVVVSYSNVSLYRIDLSASYPVTSIGGWAGDFSVPSIDIGVASGLTAGTSYIFTILSNGFISYSAEL